MNITIPDYREQLLVSRPSRYVDVQFLYPLPAKLFSFSCLSISINSMLKPYSKLKNKPPASTIHVLLAESQCSFSNPQIDANALTYSKAAIKSGDR